MYSVQVPPKVAKAIHRLDKPLQQLFKEKLQEIAKNPHKGNALTRDLKGLWSYHFSYRGVAYRIIYEIYEESLLVLIVLVGTRENIYERLRRSQK